MKQPHDVARRLLGADYETLDAPRTRNVARHVAGRTHIARHPDLQQVEHSGSVGPRAADAVARFGGSWTFILLFMLVLVVWVVLNSFLLAGQNKVFDPYPYILLNLFLSMLAAIQAPIILMSQNRQSEKDRLNAEHDYEVNLKAELEIMLLHEKVDQLREKQWTELLAPQQQQLQLLADLIAKQGRSGSGIRQAAWLLRFSEIATRTRPFAGLVRQPVQIVVSHKLTLFVGRHASR